MDAYLAGKDHDDDGESDLIAQILSKYGMGPSRHVNSMTPARDSSLVAIHSSLNGLTDTGARKMFPRSTASSSIR